MEAQGLSGMAHALPHRAGGLAVRDGTRQNAPGWKTATWLSVRYTDSHAGLA